MNSQTLVLLLALIPMGIGFLWIRHITRGDSPPDANDDSWWSRL